MNFIYKHLFISFLITVLIFSCGKWEHVSFSDIAPIHVPAELDSIIEIKNWLALGPFEFDTLKTHPTQSFFIEDLKPFGITEGTIDEIAIKKLLEEGVPGFMIKTPSSRVRLFNYVVDSIEVKSNLYLVTRIISAKAQDVSFMIDGSNSYAAWLNGEKFIEIRGKYSNVKIGDRFINVSLREGENMLFVKVNRSANVYSWDLVFNISSNREAKRVFCINYSSDFVRNPVVTDSLDIYTGPFMSGKVEVTDLEDKIIHAASFENQNTNFKPFVVSDLGGLKEGFYKVRLTVGEEKYGGADLQGRL